MKKIYNIDAAGKKIGRIATEIASCLTGKNTTSYMRNEFPDVEVNVSNASQMSIDEKKSVNKEYKSYSGYSSGLKEESLEKLASRKGFGEILRKAVYGMVPSNRLRAKIMKNLNITE
ncbi:MAG: 50S ribosomal protein L13 [bacterium]